MFELITTHGGYQIMRRPPGFEFTPVLLGKITAYLALTVEGRPGVFAFMYRFPDLQPGSQRVDEASLADLAVGTITGVIDAGGEVEGRERTYVLRAGGWVEVREPPWWVSAFG